MSLRANLADLERQLTPRETIEIIVHGGVRRSGQFGRASFGEFGATVIDREPEEEVGAFRARVRAAAKAGGAEWIALGDLAAISSGLRALQLILSESNPTEIAPFPDMPCGRQQIARGSSRRAGSLLTFRA